MFSILNLVIPINPSGVFYCSSACVPAMKRIAEKTLFENEKGGVAAAFYLLLSPCLRGYDRDRLAVAPVRELDLACGFREYGVVLAHAGVGAGVYPGAPLPHDYGSGFDQHIFAGFNAEPLSG
jgi:hypothetical protein